MERPFTIVEVDARDRDMLARIGRLRVDVWEGEGSLSEELRRSRCWLDEFDAASRHWIARRESDGELVACARLSIHATLADSPDGYVWLEAGRDLPGPIANISKLVVRRDAR